MWEQKSDMLACPLKPILAEYQSLNYPLTCVGRANGGSNRPGYLSVLIIN